MKPASRGSGRVGSGGFQNLAGRVGSGRAKTFQKSRGSDWVGSRRLEILTGRDGSATPTRPARFDPTCEKPSKFLRQSHQILYVFRVYHQVADKGGESSGLFTGHDQAVGLSRDFQQLARQVGSGQEMFEISRVGSGRVRRFSMSRFGSGHPYSIRSARSDPTPEQLG